MDLLSNTVKNSFPAKRIVIIGDLVADQFLRGTIARVSREAPVFILRHDETETCAGGAANAAVNVASLGGRPVLIGVTGQDANGDLLRQTLHRSGVDCEFVVADTAARTTTKVRVVAGQQYAARQQVIRIDYENEAPLSSQLIERLLANVRHAARDADAIIISDYNYGVAGTEIFQLAKMLAAKKSIPLVIDSRFRLRDFQNADSATPNQDEVEGLIGKNFTAELCMELRERLGFQSLLVTRGNQGMLLVQKGSEPPRIDAVGAAEPVDVTGAGDTVIAVYALGLAAGLSYSDSAAIANHAGGIVVMKKGTASVSPDELLESIRVNSTLNHSESSA